MADVGPLIQPGPGPLPPGSVPPGPPGSGGGLGGVAAYTAPANQFINSIGANGQPASAQPSSLNLSDTLALTPFTPTFTFGTSVGDLTVTYTNQVGWFMKLGRLLFFTAQVSCTPTFTSSTGAASVTLPGFPPALAGSFPVLLSGRINGTGVTYAAGQIPVASMGTVGVPSAFFVFMTTGAAIGTLTQANVASGVALQIVMTGFYVTAT